MKKNVTPGMIEWISRNWEDSQKAPEVQDLVEAIVAELKQDYRDAQRSGRRAKAAFLESLIGDAQDEMFWDKLDYLLHFNFDY
jgi:hypothetical protein